MRSSPELDKLLSWERFSQTYFLTGPPMRPSAEDLANYWDLASGWIRGRKIPRVLLLGVTPGLYDLPWPQGTDFLAADSSQAMIDAIWSGPRHAVRCEDWLSLDLPNGSRDIVLCDGGLHLLNYPQRQHELIRFLHRILSEDGLCIFRLFVLPSQRETPDAVIQDLLDGKISGPIALRLRLALSLQNDAKEGVEFGEVYSKLMKEIPDMEKLAAMMGWPMGSTLTINSYKDLKYKYHFLTLQQTIDLFCLDPGGFHVQQLRTFSYELGQRCPTIALRPCPRGKNRESLQRF